MHPNFFSRSAQTVAQELLGKYLVRRVNGKTKAYKIVETEAYVGPHDKASHAHRGRTKRNEPMWGPPGHWYVYFTYGMHYMLNLVMGKDGYPSAVLIRAVESASNYSSILQNTAIRKRGVNTSNYSLIRANKRIRKKLDGPGKLTKALKIDYRLNTKKCSRKSGLWIEDRGERVSPRQIKRTPRIGIHYAEEWADMPLRFVLEKKSRNGSNERK